MSALISFYVISSIIFCYVLHGAFIFFMFLFAAANYAIARTFLGSNVNIYVTWIFNLLVLYCNEVFSGYKFGDVFGTQFAFLDQHKGMFPWFWVFNMSMLRMVSFNTDLFWSVNNRQILAKDGSEITFHIHKSTCDQCSANGEGSCYWWREKLNANVSEFTFWRYFAYVFYVPLIIGGPIISFNAFNSYLNRPQTSYNTRSLILYALRWAAIFLFFEVYLHYIYPWAVMSGVTRSGERIWVALKWNAADMAVMSYLLLNALFLKFLLIWRFFRLWALVDGIETIENMDRCISNLYSIESFWKSWHRSFNRWLIRYVYVPLGGAAKSFIERIRNIFVVFVFVALWHDMTMSLLIWGAMMSVFLAPELLAGMFLRRNGWLEERPWFRFAKGSLVTITILILITANLVGYGGGWDSTKQVLIELLSVKSIPTWIVILSALQSAVQVMFEVRARERRIKDIEGSKANPA